MRLEPPNGTATRGFTDITSVRELLDGRLLVADHDENQLYVVDWAADVVHDIGREGEGPGEYRRIGSLYATWEDGTLLTDGISRRWLLLQGTDVVRTIASRRPLNQSLGAFLYGADQRGRVLDTKGVVWRPSLPINVDGNADSLAVLLVGAAVDDSKEPVIDTIARIAASGPNSSSVGGCLLPGSAAVAVRPGSVPPSGSRNCVKNPIFAPDQVLLFPDGWVGIAYVDPYRVDWRDPSGRWVRGSTIPHARVPMTDEERCAAVRGWSFRGIEDCEEDEISEISWQEMLPPFMLPLDATMAGGRLRALFAAPDGSLLIRRTPTANDLGNRYDLIDRTGRVRRRFALPPNEVVAGFGRASIYTIRVDELDLQWLRRHPWPTELR